LMDEMLMMMMMMMSNANHIHLKNTARGGFLKCC
jgi:hypothetical protein